MFELPFLVLTSLCVSTGSQDQSRQGFRCVVATDTGSRAATPECISADRSTQTPASTAVSAGFLCTDQCICGPRRKLALPAATRPLLQSAQQPQHISHASRAAFCRRVCPATQRQHGCSCSQWLCGSHRIHGRSGPKETDLAGTQTGSGRGGSCPAAALQTAARRDRCCRSRPSAFHQRPTAAPAAGCCPDAACQPPAATPGAFRACRSPLPTQVLRCRPSCMTVWW